MDCSAVALFLTVVSETLRHAISLVGLSAFSPSASPWKKCVTPPQRRDRSNGSALVEMALSLPLCVVLIGGALTFGSAFSKVDVIENAARQGARYGATQPTDVSGIKARVLEEAVGSGVTIDSNKITVTTSLGTTSGAPITVRIAFSFSPILLPLLQANGIVGTNVVTFTRDCTMVIF